MTTPDASPRSDSTETPASPWKEIGYDTPFDANDMTPGSAHQLHDVQGIGGPVAARIAARPEALTIIPPEVQYNNAQRWLNRKKAEAETYRAALKAARASDNRSKIASAIRQLEINRKQQIAINVILGNLTLRLTSQDNNE